MSYLPAIEAFELKALVFVAVLGPLYLLNPYRTRRFDRRIDLLFAGNHDESLDPVIDEMRTSINQEFPGLFLSPGRAASIPFRGQQIYLIHGKVGRACIGETPWISSTGLYAIAGPEQFDWMRRNSDVFTLGYEGTKARIYWVKLSAIERFVNGPGWGGDPL